MTKKINAGITTLSQLKDWVLLAGPIAGLLVYYFLLQAGLESDAAITAGITLLCVLWWVFEPVPIPVTSLIPLAMLQIFGVLSKNEVAEAYGSPLILLLLGGFIISKAMERSGAHRRIALGMINLFGGNSSRQLVFGFMATSAVLSMWISNTATTLMLLPVALAVLEKAEDRRLAAPLMLGIAYAASIGGIGTPIGTPPNLVFMQVYEEQAGKSVGFTEWMTWGVPVVLLMVPVTGLWLTRSLTYRGGFHLPEVGKWRVDERRVLMIFALTALAWITRKEPFGGWTELLGVNANDASVALTAVILMFVVPNGRGEKLLDWPTAASIPWGVLLLFGGGICLAKGFVASGLSTMVGDALAVLANLPLILMMLALCLGVTFLTEATSNTASTVLLMPVLAAAALAAAVDPRLLMVPAAISASCAFMLPVATAPNSIIYGSGCVTTQQMAREGFVLNILGALVISGVCYLLLI
ncbi:probable transporter [marine gamma proteobacterium HTCC2143]|uniref:Probable transporter n=1 Tax=marine gamma proteobacterium HTCC2143 TaxID=247633 RepID=A0Y9X4_9GAMM|nr:probable transporter [marine gamma proteobacterium HTCC2143]